MFTMRQAALPRSLGSVTSMKASMPLLGRPMLLSRPDGVSHRRGIGLPRRGFLVMVFTTTAPASPRSQNGSISSPRPAVPEAVMMGLARRSGPTCTDRSTVESRVAGVCSTGFMGCAA
jgi:hypothetical protein